MAFTSRDSAAPSRFLFLDLEVLAYLKGHDGSGTRWLAIDDDREHYPSDAPVLLVDPAKGLDESAAADLARRLG